MTNELRLMSDINEKSSNIIVLDLFDQQSPEGFTLTMTVIPTNKKELLYFFHHFCFAVIKVDSNGFSDFFSPGNC